jgi:hypothetical protein
VQIRFCWKELAGQVQWRSFIILWRPWIDIQTAIEFLKKGKPWTTSSATRRLSTVTGQGIYHVLFFFATHFLRDSWLWRPFK